MCVYNPSNLYRDASPKRCQHSQTSRAKSPLNHFLNMVQHVADWVAPFPRSQHSPPSPHKLLHIPPSPPPSCSFTYVHES